MLVTRYPLWCTALIAATAMALEPPSALKECYATSANRIEVSRCLARERDIANAEMERCAQTVRARMQELDAARGRTQAVTAFAEAQKAFEAYRERNCLWVAARMEPSTGAGDAARDCMIRMTRARSAELASSAADCRDAPGQQPGRDGQ